MTYKIFTLAFISTLAAYWFSDGFCGWLKTNSWFELVIFLSLTTLFLRGLYEFQGQSQKA